MAFKKNIVFNRTSYGLFFAVVYVYIVGSFCWWWWLLYNNNRQNFETVVDRELITANQYGQTAESFYKGQYYSRLTSEFKRKNAMLMAEGLVFISLISIGFVRIRNSFRNEIRFTRQQNNFLLSITHELKSPLASLKLSMQTLQKHSLSQDQILRLSHISLSDIDRLENLVENILLASRMDGSDFSIVKEPVELSDMCRQILTQIRHKYEDKRTFQQTIDKGVYLMGDKLLLSSVIYNLLDNACKYSFDGDTIHLVLQRSNESVVLKVSDTGAGIVDSEKPLIFKRFYRIGNESTRTAKGTGLGLFIVKQVLQLHGASIQVRNNHPKGTVFEINFPVTE